MGMISTLGYFVVTLFILILVHEFGHFIVARGCGVTVERFSFGFGTVLWSWQDKKGTEYAWSLWPLGGYVKLLDDSPEHCIINLLSYKLLLYWQGRCLIFCLLLWYWG